MQHNRQQQQASSGGKFLQLSRQRLLCQPLVLLTPIPNITHSQITQTNLGNGGTAALDALRRGCVVHTEGMVHQVVSRPLHLGGHIVGGAVHRLSCALPAHLTALLFGRENKKVGVVGAGRAAAAAAAAVAVQQGLPASGRQHWATLPSLKVSPTH